MAVSCGDDCDDSALETEVQNINDNIATTSVEFLRNPTDTDSCQDFKDAGQDLLDFIDENESCFEGDELEEIQQSRDELVSSLAQLSC